MSSKKLTTDPSEQNRSTHDQPVQTHRHLLVVSTLTALLGIAGTIEVLGNYPIGTLDRPGPGFFPLVICGFLLISALLGLLEWIFRDRMDLPPYEPLTHLLRNYRFYVITVVILLTAPAIYFFGYLVSGIPAGIIVSTLVYTKISWKPIVAGAAIPVGIYIVFDALLGISLP